MSVDFTAILAVVKPLPPWDQLPKAFERLGSSTDAVVERWRSFWSVNTWTAYESGQHLPHGFVDVVGPGGFSVTIGPKAAQLYHCCRWRLFTSDNETCHMLRLACHEVARLFGSEKAIYVAELTPTAFHSGQSFEAIEAGLREKFGAPAESISAIATEEYWGPDCYFIDDFGDIAK